MLSWLAFPSVPALRSTNSAADCSALLAGFIATMAGSDFSPPYIAGVGSAWVWTRSNGVWTQQGNKLFGNDAVGVASQGSSVALSADGNTAIVGGPGDNSNAGAAWVFVQPAAVPFSAFSAQLTVYPKRFSINSNFALGPISNGIDPPTQPVTLQIGSFTTTIPPGSFVRAGALRHYSFVGVISGVNLSVVIQLTSANNYIFNVTARNVSLTVSSPVTITLTIGNDRGTTTVTPVVINTG